MKKLFITVAMLAASLISAGLAQAATQTGNLSLQASVTSVCQIGTLAMVNFGTYTGSNIVSNGTLGVTCNTGTPYTIYMNAGTNFVGGYRRLSYLGNFIDYAFYDSGTGSQWGDSGYAGTYVAGTGVSGVGTGTNINHAYNVWLYGGAIVPAGTYYDNVVVTVAY